MCQLNAGKKTVHSLQITYSNLPKIESEKEINQKEIKTTLLS